MFSRLIVGAVLLGVLAGCQGAGGDPVVGKYQMQGGDAVMGQGADKTVLELKADKTFSIDMATLHFSEGKWSSDGKTVTIIEGKAFVPSFRVDGTKLVPIKEDGSEITTWGFVKK